METQIRILTKSHELFMLYGIRSVSMDEIANHLGMSKKTIYQYFKDKDALVEGVINIEIEMHQDEFSKYAAISENAIHEIFLTLDTVEEMLKHMNPSVMFDLQKYHSTAFEKFRTHKNTFFYDIIKANIERGKQEGLFRADIHVDVLTRFRLANMFLMFDFEHFPSNKFTPIQIISETTDNFLHGMSTQAGLKAIEAYKQERKNK
jgi:AcrR family transcriptional regulator